MTFALTERQAAALEVIRRAVETTGIAPTCQELADALGSKSKGQIVPLLRILEERGHIRRLPNRPRAIELLPSASMTDAAIDEMDRFAIDHASGRLGGRNDYMNAFERIVRAGARV